MSEHSSKVVSVANGPLEAALATEAEIAVGFAEPHAFVDVGHSQLAYYAFGEGPDLVFAHGWPIYSATFRRILPWLVPEFRCHLLDLPGAGRTRIGPSSPIDLAAHASTLRRAVDELGLRRFAWVAHDSGGVVARLAADDDPRVVGLVLGGSEIPGHRPWVIQMYAAMSRIPMTAHLVRLLMRLRAVRASAIGFGGCFADPSYAEGEFRRLFVQGMLESQTVTKNHMRLLQKLDFDLIDGLAAVHRRIRAPVRMIWGTLDPFFPIELARGMREQFPSADLVEIPGAKLFAHEDFPAEFAEPTREFLRACFARKTSNGADIAPQAALLKRPA